MHRNCCSSSDSGSSSSANVLTTELRYEQEKFSKFELQLLMKLDIIFQIAILFARKYKGLLLFF